MRLPHVLLWSFAATTVIASACSSPIPKEGYVEPQDDGGGTSGGSGGPIIGSSSSGGGISSGDLPGDPCELAAASASYVGCDYWPTVTANAVDPVFDFAVVVSNVGADTAHVRVTGPSNTDQEVEVEPGGLTTIYLPWVESLKGGRAFLANSVVAKSSAFHLVSDRPVVVYQFNALEYKGEGGPPGKSWTSCVPGPTGKCYSYTNDASILMPSTAMTTSYRVLGSAGWTNSLTSIPSDQAGAFVAITATQDGTEITLRTGDRGDVVAGNGVTATGPNGTLTLTLDAGDVAELITKKGKRFDLSGSLISANKPFQVISGVPCLYVPDNKQACDHVETTVFPAETLGKDYVVPRPSGPFKVVDHVVRLIGNVDGTTLTYSPSRPQNCPESLSAGEVVDCGIVNSDFRVTGNHEFGVITLTLGGEVIQPDSQTPLGDPSMSTPVAVEQFRKNYVLLAPLDYKESFVDVLAPANTVLTLDGDDVSSSLSAVDGTDFQIARIKLKKINGGAHTLEGSEPIGVQVLGYGENTTYQYPGGLNLTKIAPAPN